MYMSRPSPATRQAGFTLVELSIVLFIIGIIIASVMKGQDLIASAQVTKAQQGYFLKWLEIVDAYHEVTGKILCDGEENGAPAAYTDAENGFMDGITYLESNDQDRNVLVMQRLRQVGLNPCTLISGNIFDAIDDDLCKNDLNVYEYNVNSVNRGKERVTLGLTSFTAEIDDDSVHRNFIIFLNIPLDYAVRLDKLIDGYADGEHGKCLNLSRVASGTSSPYAHLTQAGLRPGDNPTSNPWPGPDDNSNSIDNLFALGIMLDY